MLSEKRIRAIVKDELKEQIRKQTIRMRVLASCNRVAERFGNPTGDSYYSKSEEIKEAIDKELKYVGKVYGISKWLHREEGSEKVKKFSDFIKKSAEPQKKEPASNVIKGRFKITKSDDDKHLAFGWANVAIRADGEEIEDWQEDIIEPEELENAAYQYVLLYREGGEMHERGGAAVLVESVVFTEEKMQAMGIPAGTLPIGWWIGFKVTDEDVWEKVKDGTYPMFSIEGEAERVEVEDENTL